MPTALPRDELEKVFFEFLLTGGGGGVPEDSDELSLFGGGGGPELVPFIRTGGGGMPDGAIGGGMLA